MNFLVVSPVLVPLLTAALTALLASRAALQRGVSLLGAGISLLCSASMVYLAAQGQPLQVTFGVWAQPYGIGFSVDRLSAIMLLIASLIGLVSLIFLAGDTTAGSSGRFAMQIPLMHGLLAGVGGTFATADIFNLYVWFEVMLISSLGLISGGAKLNQLEGTLKYMSLNMLATMMLLTAVSLVYGLTGHLSFEGLRAAWPHVQPHVAAPVLALLCLALLAKAGAFPVYAWLPPSYPVLPASVLALFAGLLTKTGTYAILRLLGDVFAAALPAWLGDALGWLACLTMLAGVLGAAYHWDMRHILSLHIISQIGYILLAIALGTRQGFAAALVFTIHNILAKANLFLIAAMIARYTGSYDLRRIGGLYAARPALAVLFGISALALVGIPPFSGFWAKLLVLQATYAQSHMAWMGIALLVSVLTMYSMMKIWMEAFWKAHPQAAAGLPLAAVPAREMLPAWVATLILTAAILAISLYPQPLLAFANAAAQALGLPAGELPQ